MYLFSYVKFKRVDRYSSSTPPLSGPISSLGFPLQRVCNKVLMSE